MKYNTKFTLGIEDLNHIEDSLSLKIAKLSLQRLEYSKADQDADSIQLFDNQIRELQDLLAKLHSQKRWYRPKNKIYISG